MASVSRAAGEAAALRAGVARDQRSGLGRGHELDLVARGDEPQAALAEHDLEIAEQRVELRSARRPRARRSRVG